VNESLSNQQKEFFLRQQLAAIQRELVALQAKKSNIPGSRSAFAPNPNNNNALSDIDPEFDDPSETEIANDNGSLSSIKRSILRMRPNSEERIAGIREWKRLKRIPNGSVESGVVRTYVSFFFFLF